MTNSSRVLTSSEACVLLHATNGVPCTLSDIMYRRAEQSLRVRGILDEETLTPTRQAKVALDLHFAELGHRKTIRPH